MEFATAVLAHKVLLLKVEAPLVALQLVQVHKMLAAVLTHDLLLWSVNLYDVTLERILTGKSVGTLLTRKWRHRHVDSQMGTEFVSEVSLT